MTVISIVAPPSNAQQVHTALPAVSVPQSLIDPVEERILRAVRTSEPIHVWKLLNRLVQEESLPSRREVRQRKVELCRLVSGLMHRQVLFPAGRHAVTTKPSPALATYRCRVRPRKPSTVVNRASGSVGRAVEETSLAERAATPKEPANQVPTVPGETSKAIAQAQSGPPLSPQEASDAARALAALQWQRQPKKWSGWLDKRTRIWRWRRVVVDGCVFFAYGCLRGKLIISLDCGELIGFPGEPGLRWKVVPASTATVWRNPHAQALGRLKRGKKEKYSPLKAETSRRNGAMRASVLKPTAP